MSTAGIFNKDLNEIANFLKDGANVEWLPLGDVCDFKNGFAFKSSLFKDSGMPIVRITNINGKNIDLSDVKFFNILDYKENLSKYEVCNGDVLVAMSGATTGKIGYYNKNETAYLNQRVGKFEPNLSIIKNKFLYHFLLLNSNYIYQISGGGVQPNLSSAKLMKNLLIPIPFPNDPKKSLEEQQRIVDILDKFDTLINSINDGLPREIELRQQQYEYYRDMLFKFPKNSEVK